MKSIKSILTEAFQKIANDHGVVFNDLSINWLDARDMNSDLRIVESISSSNSVIIEPCETSDD